MGKPTEQELHLALLKAVDMREHDQDPYYVAKTLLSLNYRYQLWQKVIDATKLYLRSGLGATEHARLVKAIEEADKAEGSLTAGAAFGLE